MFTGIVETMGKVEKIERDKGNIHFTIQADTTNELHVDQSMAHDGVCLTVVKINPQNSSYVVTAIQETLNKTNMGQLVPGSKINLERCTRLEGRLDGHMVQGHVDQTATCVSVEETDGSWKYTFRYDPQGGNVTVSKGSISVNGVSLTVVDSEPDTFSVAIIPFTYEHTNFHTFKPGTIVNIEFDILGKYVEKLLKLHLGK